MEKIFWRSGGQRLLRDNAWKPKHRKSGNGRGGLHMLNRNRHYRITVPKKIQRSNIQKVQKLDLVEHHNEDWEG